MRVLALCTPSVLHRRVAHKQHVVRCEASPNDARGHGKQTRKQKDQGLSGLGDVLGPIGLTIGQVDTKACIVGGRVGVCV